MDFAGWELPLSYGSPVDEHLAVRRTCGLFDVSHMGELELRGPQAQAVCQELTVNDVARLKVGDGQYSMLCNEQGGVIDDVIVFRLEERRYLMVVNAANTERDLAWIRGYNAGRAEIADRSADVALLALQGPLAEQVLRSVTAADPRAMRSFTIREGRVAGYDALVSRTGYTGEDGFEIFVGGMNAGAVWEQLLSGVRGQGGLAAGLAARDTLRLEAALPLCGSDMDGDTTPFEAGLGWVVKLGKGEFVGRPALEAQRVRGVRRSLVGIQMQEARIPRHGYEVRWQDRVIGSVTSGARAPLLGTFIGLAYVGNEAAKPGTNVAVDIRGRHVAARVVERPFYRRARRESP